MISRGCIIFVDGIRVGYQFNKKSMGSRTFRDRVVKDGYTYLPYPLCRVVPVKPIDSNTTRFFEVV